MNRRSAAIALAIMSPLAPSGTAAARGKVRLRGTGLSTGQRYSGAVLTRDQLAACVRNESSVNAQDDALAVAEEALQQRKVQLDVSDALVSASEASLDQHSRQAVNSHNQRVRQHRQLVLEYNDLVSEYNRKVEVQRANIANFNASCAGKAYYDADMNAVRAAGK